MFEDRIKALARKKAELNTKRATMALMVERVMQSREYVELQDEAAILESVINDLDDEIRHDAIGQYNETGEKRPHPAVGIRITTKLIYPAGKALLWCIDNMRTALKYDKRMFEKHARAVADTIPVEFVHIKKEPQATISRDLSDYLAEVQDGN